MSIPRFFGYVVAGMVFGYAMTKTVGLLNARDDAAVCLGLGGIVGLCFLGTLFVKYAIEKETKKEKPIEE